MSALLSPRPEAVTAWHRLAGALAALADEGRVTPCMTDPAPFTSEVREDRAEAAESCSWCPALAACGSFAELNREPHWVWGGIDRTPGHARSPRRREAA